MSNVIHVYVPSELASKYFFSDNKITLHTTEIKECHDHLLVEPFVYEVAHYSNLEAWQPWNSPEVSMPKLFEQWAFLRETLEQLFIANRRATVAEPMKQGIIIFLESLFWFNRVPVSLVKGRLDVSPLKWKPLNGLERFEFIFRRPSHYHSFVQLSELMKEIEKRFYANMSRLNK